VNLEMPRKIRRTGKTELEEQIKYTEQILQSEIIATPEIVPIKKERRGEKRIVRINPRVSVCLPENTGIKIKWKKDKQGDHLYLQRAEQILDIWPDSEDNRAISIGNKDYYITREDKLIEVIEGGILDIIPRRKPRGKDYQLAEDEEGGLVINLREIGGNDQINKLFQK